MRSILAHAVLFGGLALAMPVEAAEEPAPAVPSTSCTAYIDALPYTINSPGHYCLRANLSTGHFNAILVNASDASLDCRNRVIELQAGADPRGAEGVRVGPGAHDVIVENCIVRGFDRGIVTPFDTANLAIQNNRVERFLSIGIHAGGDGLNVVNNRVTGGGSLDNATTGIWVMGTPARPATGQVVMNNLLAGLHGIQVTGISAFATTGLRLINNHVMGMRTNGNAGWVYGIVAYGGGLSNLQVINNSVSAMSPDQLFYPMYADPVPALCRGNTVYNHGSIPFLGCATSVDNVTVQTPLY